MQSSLYRSAMTLAVFLHCINTPYRSEHVYLSLSLYSIMANKQPEPDMGEKELKIKHTHTQTHPHRTRSREEENKTLVYRFRSPTGPAGATYDNRKIIRLDWLDMNRDHTKCAHLSLSLSSSADELNCVFCQVSVIVCAGDQFNGAQCQIWRTKWGGNVLRFKDCDEWTTQV